MYTRKDIELKTIFVLNCFTERSLRVKCGELFLEEKRDDGTSVTLTKFPFQKILALFVVGNITITSPLLEKCKKFNIPVVVTKLSLRPVFFWSESAEANYLLRQRQHRYADDDLTIARWLVRNKIHNQITLLKNIRKKGPGIHDAISLCEKAVDGISDAETTQELMGLEGLVAKSYFGALFEDIGWSHRAPRTKIDELNVTLDIGYTILFNFVECFLRMFGFDLYVGVYHRLWFKRKSLVCDIIEPFRCIVDRCIRNAFHKRQFKMEDFEVKKGEYLLKRDYAITYYKSFFDALVPYKTELFVYVQTYYRCFMGQKDIRFYPIFQI